MRTSWTFALAVLAVSGAAHGHGATVREVYIHDGFYARLGVGSGYVLGTAGKQAVSGFALSTELAFGGTVAPGLVIGGGSYSMVVPGPTYSSDAGPDVDAGTHHISGFGPFIDYYLAPRQGAHVQAALLLSGAFVQEKGVQESASGFGFGAMVGAGYELWVGHEWSLGPLVRLTFYNDRIEGSDSGGAATLRMFVPSLLVGATYH